MNCELAHERIVLAAYSELADELVHELDRHLDGCQACTQEREQLLALKLLADANPLPEVPANLVARSRMRLNEALDTLPPKRWVERLSQRIRNNFASLLAAPVAAVLLLLAGAGAGMLGGYRYAQSLQALPATVTQQAEAVAPLPSSAEEVANVSSIVRQPNS